MKQSKQTTFQANPIYQIYICQNICLSGFKWRNSSIFCILFSHIFKSQIFFPMHHSYHELELCKYHLLVFLADSGRYCRVFVKLGSLFHLGGFSCVLISSGRSFRPGRLDVDPSLIFPFLAEPEALLTTPRILKFFSLFLSSFHLFLLSSFLFYSSLRVVPGLGL